MADHYLNSVFDLSGVPRLALGGINARAQNCRSKSFVTQDSLKAGGNVVLLVYTAKTWQRRPSASSFLISSINLRSLE